MGASNPQHFSKVILVCRQLISALVGGISIHKSPQHSHGLPRPNLPQNFFPPFIPFFPKPLILWAFYELLLMTSMSLWVFSSPGIPHPPFADQIHKSPFLSCSESLPVVDKFSRSFHYLYMFSSCPTGPTPTPLLHLSRHSFCYSRSWQTQSVFLCPLLLSGNSSSLGDVIQVSAHS